MSVAFRRATRALVLAGESALVTLCLAWAILERPAPLINVRWREGLSVAARRETERRLYLENGEPLGEATRYELTSPRPSELAAIVAHPDVLDTHGIDRRRATLATDTGRGSLRVWWAGPFKGLEGRRRFRILVLVVGVLTVVGSAIANRRGLRFARRSNGSGSHAHRTESG